MRIFAETAPAYFARGISVMPLTPRSKRPIFDEWQLYSENPVQPHEQKLWLDNYGHGNIGMVLGKQSGVMMLDIDTEDPVLFKLIVSLLPASPWQRVGQKGMVLAYRYSGLRTFRIRTRAGGTICELLSDRTQCVLPPSIHPDTLRPYTANCDLVDVLDELPVLDPQVEQILRGALREAGVDLSISGQSRITDFVSRGSRDVTLTEKAGLFAYAVLRGERSVKEAVGMLRSWNTEFIEKVAGDDVEIDKHVHNLFRFVRRDVLERGKILPDGWDEGLTDEEKRDWGLEFGADNVEWSFDDMKAYLRDQFEAHLPESQQRANAIDKILRKVATGKLMKLDEERLLSYISDVSGTGLKLSSLRKRLAELRQGEIAGTDHSEIARAVLKELEQVYIIRKHAGALWRYTGSHWEPLPEGVVLAKISHEYGGMAAAKRSSDHRGILSVMLYIAKEGIEEIESEGINFANGFLDENMQLVEHSHRLGMTYTLPFRYMPELAGKSTEFFKFLEMSWGRDKDYEQKKAALQEALCVTLFGLGPRYQRAILLRGVPKSGKSQLLRIAQSLVPETAISYVPPDQWADRFMPTQMHEKLINVAGELSEKRRIDGQRFKDIVDGTEMQGQYKGRDIFKFKPRCTHWFASNHSPRTDDTSEGFNRRWLFLEFNRAVSSADRKIDLGDTIVAEEREAIVAWAVLALPRLIHNREYTLPESHKQVVREVAQANNSVRFFLEEAQTVQVSSASNLTSETRLYKEYWSFCMGPGGAQPVSSRGFRAIMRELQQQIGFELVLVQTELGAVEAFYRCLTIVEGSKKKS